MTERIAIPGWPALVPPWQTLDEVPEAMHSHIVDGTDVDMFRDFLYWDLGGWWI